MDNRLFHYAGSSPRTEVLCESHPMPYSVGQMSPWRLSSPMSPFRTTSPWPLFPAFSPPFRNHSPWASNSNIWSPDHAMGPSVRERSRSTFQEQISPHRLSFNTLPQSSSIAASPLGSFVIPTSENIASRQSFNVTPEVVPHPRVTVVDELPPVAPNRARFSQTQWENHRPHIHKLYLDEDKTLDEVREIMTERFHFTPS